MDRVKKHPLRIITIVNAFGGSGISGTEQSLALAQRGHHVTMVTYSENALPAVSHPNLEVHFVEPVFYGGTPAADFVLSFAAAVKSSAGENPVDVIHAHYALTHGDAALLGRDAIVYDSKSPRPHRPAVVITCRGTDITRFAGDPRVAPGLRYILSRADGLTFVSEGLRSVAGRQLQLSQAGRVIPNFSPALGYGCDSCHLIPGSFHSSVVFFHISNFRTVKNVDWIVRAFAQAFHRSAHTVQLKLILVGDGPTRPATENVARHYGITEHVAFIGTVSPEQVRDVIRQADVLLMASESEGCPRVVLEAMMEAKPVIATNVDGLNEMIRDGQTGRLCPPGDLDLFSAAILELAQNEESRRQLGINGKADGERRYDRDKVMSAYEDVYAEAIARAQLER